MPSRLLVSKPSDISKLKHVIRGNNASIILDACGSEEILSKVMDLPSKQCICLYQGKAYEELWAVAPYLVQLDKSLLNWLVNTIWDEPWGILIIATCDSSTLHRHLRKFLFVQDYNKKTLYFRFYDPRVLDSFLPTCNESELIRLFGPILKIGIKLEKPGLINFISPRYYNSDQINPGSGN